jgi:HD-like signal output (HDOD) protein
VSTVVLQVLERDLPELPPQIAGVVEELKDPNVINRDALIRKIEECGNLSEVVQNAVNLGRMRRGRRARSLDDAILLVGLEATRHIILSVLLQALFPPRQLLENFDRENFLRHCLGTGLAAQLLCIEAGLSEQYDSYKLINYGLIHDIGILALDRCLPVTLNRIFQIATEERIPILQAEVKVLGRFTHSVIGEWVCGKWHLPADIRSVVQHHHAPRRAEVNKQETILMHIADTISFNYYESLLESVHKYGIEEELVRSLGLSMAQISKVEEALPERVERALEILDFKALNFSCPF